MSINVDLAGNSVIVSNIQSESNTTGSTGVIIPAYEYAVTLTLTSSSASQTIWLNPNLGGTYKVAGA